MGAAYWIGDNGYARVTYNLGRYLRAFGLPDWRAMEGAPPVELAGVLAGVARHDAARRVCGQPGQRVGGEPMTGLDCSTSGCSRRGVRTVNGARCCLFHPDEEPPDLDPDGKKRDPKKVEQARKKAAMSRGKP